MKYLIPVLPVLAGFLLDAAIGDPYSIPHPIRAIGTFISKLEKAVRSRFTDLRRGGVFLALTVMLFSTAIPACIVLLCYRINTWLGAAVESVLCCYMLAARNLRDETRTRKSESDRPMRRSASTAAPMTSISARIDSSPMMSTFHW